MIDSVSQSLRMALKSIGGNKLRAFLTMLGIIIGVMALVILVSLVNGATGTVTDTISSLGSNLLTVTISDDKGYQIVWDRASAMSIIFASPKIDISNEVLAKMGYSK